MSDEQIAQAAGFILLLLGGVGGVGASKLIDWLKMKLNLSGYGALLATAAVSTVIATLTLIVEGQLTAGAVNWGNLPYVAGLVFVAAQAQFRMLRDREVGKQVAQVRYDAAVAQQLAGDALDQQAAAVKQERPHGVS